MGQQKMSLKTYTWSWQKMHNLLQYSSNYSHKTGSLWFYSKDKATNFNADIVYSYNFKSFRCKSTLVGKTTAAIGILENATIAAPLKCLSSYCKSLEMPLINCQVDLKVKWTKKCVLAVAGANANSDSGIIFTIKDTNYVPVVTLPAKSNQKLSKRFWKDLKDQFIGMNMKQKVRIKIRQTSIGIFLNQIL